MPEVPAAVVAELLDVMFHAHGDSIDVWNLVATETHCIAMTVAMLVSISKSW